MQTLDREQIQNVITQLAAIMQGALLMPERRKDDRRANGNKTQGGTIAAQVAETLPRTVKMPEPATAPQAAPPAQVALVQPKQPKDAPKKPAQAARPVSADWPFETYAAPKRPFAGYLWPYELKKMSQQRRDEYFAKLNTGEIGPDAAQGEKQGDQRTEGDDGDRRGNGAPAKRPGRKVTAPGKTQGDRDREEVLKRFAELDEKLAQAGEPLEIDFGTHSAKYQEVMVNCLNKGMPTRAAHNFAAKTAYGDNAILY